MRNLFRVVGLLTSMFALSVGWSVAEAASSQGGQTPGAAASQGQTAPGTTNVPGAQDQQATPNQQGPQMPSNPMPPSQADTTQGLAVPNSQAIEVPTSANIADQLHFTPTQKQQFSAIMEDENRQISAVNADQSLSGTDKVKKIQGIRKAGAERIKAMLTPAQAEQLTAMQQQAGPPAQSGRTPKGKVEKK